MIEQAPKFSIEELMQFVIKTISNRALKDCVNAINQDYLYWDKVKYKSCPEGYDPEQLWGCVEGSRQLSSVHVLGWEPYHIHFLLTNFMQKSCHEFDMNFGGSWESNSIIPQKDRQRFLISSLMEEAISSSQMEGASTTRKVAKEMLRKGLTPKDKSQRMIFNNYQTIRFIVEHKQEPLTEEGILHIHQLMTMGTLDDPQTEGRFRSNDDVVVENAVNHEVVHTPPSFEKIPEFVESMCQFFNQTESEQYIHPIIRGMILHYMIAYMHPFVDGNGRTARALFYWYMLRQGYWLTEYLSISRIIYKKKAAYEKSFLYSEACNNDVGYFIVNNIKVLREAFEELKLYLTRQMEKNNSAQRYMRLGGINERQAQIIRMMVVNPELVLTVKDIQVRLGVTPTTAKNDILGLMNLDLLREVPVNKVKNCYVRSDSFDKILSNL
ncbi:MAG: Fic family protein [Paludibacteraceae bacterium]|nr:Fic family protein [Paludibacteraceae bacterium]